MNSHTGGLATMQSSAQCEIRMVRSTSLAVVAEAPEPLLLHELPPSQLQRTRSDPSEFQQACVVWRDCARPLVDIPMRVSCRLRSINSIRSAPWPDRLPTCCYLIGLQPATVSG